MSEQRSAPPTDEQIERWLAENDLFLVTHLHEASDCVECIGLASRPSDEAARLAAVEQALRDLVEDGPWTERGECFWCGAHGLDLSTDHADHCRYARARALLEGQRAKRPWDHPYDADEGGRCLHCGFVGSYAHTEEFYRKWVHPTGWTLRAAEGSEQR